MPVATKQTGSTRANQSLPTRPSKGKKLGRPNRAIGHSLALRLQSHKATAILFLNDLDMQFINNEAKRNLRKEKVRQKSSECFRTEASTEKFSTPRVVIETARKQSWDILQTLKTAPDHLILMLKVG